MRRRYQFQLESVRQLRQWHRDAQRQRLGEAMHAAQLLEEQQRKVVEEVTELRQTRRQAMQQVTPDVNYLLDIQRYELLVQTQLQRLLQQQETLEAEVERRRLILAEAEQQVRVLDKLDDRRRAEFVAEELREEQLVIGEVATQMYLRNADSARE
jgi:flagellar protein FliJ